MKTKTAIAAVLCVCVPWILFYVVGNRNTQHIPTASTAQTEIMEDFNNTPRLNDFTISLLQPDGTVMDMLLNDYLSGVVIAEMPADFETEALKAQAVAARTYTLKHRNATQKHQNADVCTKASCCQAYLSYDTYLERGGSRESFDKINNAVFVTNGQVLQYDGELIDATYFSCSGGLTESALSVWGTEVPYLITQLSPGEESASVYTNSVVFDENTFLSLLGLDIEEKLRIGEIQYTTGGGIDAIDISGNIISGIELRRRLGLQSTACTISVIGNDVVITTKGYGHRVGMSQYGAEAMAVNGSTYDEILAYYYPGTELVELRTD